MSGKPSKFIISGPTIFTNNENGDIIDSGAILIAEGSIKRVGRIRDVRKGCEDCREFKLGKGLITPGLVNLHHHLYSTFARGWSPPGNPPGNFRQILKRIWWRLDEALLLDDVYYSALIGLCESILSGVTTVVDHHSSQRQVSGSLESVIAAFGATGMRGSVCFELSDRVGKKSFETGLRETVAVLKSDPSKLAGGRLIPLVGLHASMTLSDESLAEIAEATAPFSPGYHFHLAEDESDQIDAGQKYNMRATERFGKFGLLNRKSLAIHGIHLNKQEIAILKKANTSLVLCPRSNLNNAVGFPTWWDYGGISMGLGTDGIGSDILEESQYALYLSRHLRGDPRSGFASTKNLLLKNNPAVFSKIGGAKIGRIARGYKADLVYWPYIPPTPLTAENVWGHYLYGLSNLKADSVWIDGQKVLERGKFKNFDYASALDESRKRAWFLWERT